MTDENMQADAEGVDWGTSQDVPMPGYDDMVASATARTVQYPEYSPLPEARISVNFRPGDKPQITLRAASAAEFTTLCNEIEELGVYANLAATIATLNVHGTLGAGLGPVSPVGPPPAPQQGFQPPPGAPQGPNTPPPFGPNVSVPAAPGYQGPPQQQQWQQGPPAGGGWSGGGGAQNNRAEPKPRPGGWAMVDVPFNDKDRFKAMREAGKDYFKGKVQWGGKGVYWLEPSVAGYVAQQGFPVMQ